MSEVVVGAAVEVMVHNIISMLSGEIKLVRGFEDDLAKLQDALSTTQEFLLDAEEKEIKDKAAKKWLKELEDVAFEADAVLDEINYYLLQKKLKNRKQEMKKVLYSYSSGSISLFFRRKMARKINDLIMKLESVNKNAVSNGLKKEVVRAPNASDVGIVETDSFSVEPNVVGRKNDVAKIVEMVVNVAVNEKITVIPIVGMGGLGKTTVAQNVFHDKMIINHFQKRIWVCVSFDFDEVTLFQSILKTLTGEDVQGLLTKESVLQKIHKDLASKRYLIILDDVWNEDFKKWEDFVKSLLGISNVTQNVIVITTRHESVASLTKTISFHKLTSLSTDDCWSIIKTRALSGVDEPLEYEEMGKSIARKCGGLPLAANVVGGMLRGKPKEEWSSILKNQLSNFGRDDENHVMKILKLSYNRLPSSSLKRCFAYCSIFPQDFQIKKETLIGQWLAEGFLQNQENDHSEENIGNHFFNHLLHASLIQESKRDYLGNITHCTMHDIVHDLACLVSGYRSTTILKDSGNDTNKVRYLYLNSHEPFHISKEQAKYLRTLILTGEVAYKMFSCFSSLHVLKLNSSIQELPVELTKQIHMRFLDISSTKITTLPESINKLSNLRTLVVTNLQSLPNTIIDLLNLRHLHISSIELPPFIGKLTLLRTLPYYKVGHDNGCRIGELKSLKNLTGRLEIKNLERVNDKEEAKLADLCSKPNILTLVLDWTRSKESYRNDENVLEGLQPHPNLKSLGLHGYGSVNFPSWTMKMTVYNAIECRQAELTNLIHIQIEDCLCEKLPNLGHLPRLRFLKLERLHAVVSIGPSFYGLDDCRPSTMIDSVNDLKTTIMFRVLETLSLVDMPNLMEWAGMKSRVAAVFPCLGYLKIQSCPRLESAPTHFPCLKNLIIDKIGSNVCLTNICSNSNSLQGLYIKSYSGIIHSSETQENPNTLFRCLPLLQILQIHNCPELKSIPNLDLTSLRGLDIRNCPAVTWFPLELLESCTPTLERLVLMDLPNVENMDDVMSCISRMIRLERLTLIRLTKLANLAIEIGCLRGLWILELGGFSKSVDEVSFNGYLERVLQKAPHVQILSIVGNEDWVFLPDHIQHLFLYDFWIQGYGIYELPEWIVNFSALQRLSIGFCKRLRCLPSKDTIGRLTKLSHLYIEKCPLLRTQRESTPGCADSDSEWPKISHIEYVQVDNQLLPTRNCLVENKFVDFHPVPRRYTD